MVLTPPWCEIIEYLIDRKAVVSQAPEDLPRTIPHMKRFQNSGFSRQISFRVLRWFYGTCIESGVGLSPMRKRWKDINKVGNERKRVVLINKIPGSLVSRISLHLARSGYSQATYTNVFRGN